jgi:hypothetical protein
MPIKIIRDDQIEDVPVEDANPPPRIVIESSDVPGDQARFSEPSPVQPPIGETLAGERAAGVQVVTSAEPSGKSPAQTTWLVATGQCTLTTRRFSIAFRREGDVYNLKSIDKETGEGTAKKQGSLDGSFKGWETFICPHCGHPGNAKGLTEPVVYCECEQLFCGGKGLAARTVGGEDELWWRCPSCKIYKPIKRVIDSLDGTAIKGK